MNEQIVKIPQYITQVKLSDRRRAIYYYRNSRIPAKYQTDRYIFKPKKYIGGSKDVLYNALDKIFVVKNATSVGTPRFITIGGNILYAGLNEYTRAKIVNEIKNDFTRFVQQLEPVTVFPIQIDAQIHRPPDAGNWDIDNLWIYIKTFQDLLVDHNIIPDDSVKYITKAPSFEYYPVSEESERMIIFIIRPDVRAIINHILFATKPSPIIEIKGQYKSDVPVIYLSVGEQKAGHLEFVKTSLHYRASIGIGRKKLLYNDLAATLIKVKQRAIQYNTTVVINKDMATEYPNYNEDVVRSQIQKYLSNQGIPVIIHNFN